MGGRKLWKSRELENHIEGRDGSFDDETHSRPSTSSGCGLQANLSS